MMINSSTAEVPGLRPIETPKNSSGDGSSSSSSSFFASSPISPESVDSSYSGGGSSESPKEFVLPHHRNDGTGATTVFRRIRTTLTSPFRRSPLAQRVISIGRHDEENILLQSSSASGGRRGYRTARGVGSGGGSGGTSGGRSYYRNIAVLLLCIVGIVGMWTIMRSDGSSGSSGSNGGGAKLVPGASSARSAAAQQNPFTFRPFAVEGSPSEEAIDLFRQAYGTTGNVEAEDKEEEEEDEQKAQEKSYIGIDDPLNPGSIFIVLDLNEESIAGGSNARGRNNFINRDGSLFSIMNKFDADVRSYLVEKFTPSFFEAYSSENGDEESAGGSSSTTETAPKMVDVKSFYSVLADNLPHIAGSQYATPDGFTTLMEVKFAIPSRHTQSTVAIDAYTRIVVDTVKSYISKSIPSGITAEYTGLPLFRADLRPASSRPELMGASLNELLSPSAPSLKAYHNLADRFGWGIVSPYKIVFDHSDAESSIDTDAGFRLMHKVMAAFSQVDLENETREEEVEEEMETIAGLAAVNLDSIPQRIEDGHMNEHLAEVMDELYGVHPIIPDDSSNARRRASKPPMRTVYNGVAFLRNNQVPYPLYLGAKICREKQHHHCNLELLHYFTAMTDAMTSKDRMTTYITATLGVDPFSRYGIAWLMAARKKIKEMERNGDLDGYSVSIVGGASLEFDAWFQAKTAGAVGGVGEEPPSSSRPTSSHYTFLLISAAVVLVGLGIRSLASVSKQNAYSHKRH